MRSLILLLLGLAVGSICTAMAMNALARGSAYPDAVMTLMGQQMKALDQGIKLNRCASADLAPRLQALRLVANDIELAFVGMQGDVQFARYAGRLRKDADTALMAPPASCTAAMAAISKLDKACDSCHRDYRN